VQLLCAIVRFCKCLKQSRSGVLLVTEQDRAIGARVDGYDNALTETINGLYKAELIHRRGPWQTKAAVEMATLEWVSWFNTQRLLGSIGHIPPAEAEANYDRQLAERPVAELV